MFLSDTTVLYPVEFSLLALAVEFYLCCRVWNRCTCCAGWVEIVGRYKKKKRLLIYTKKKRKMF